MSSAGAALVAADPRVWRDGVRTRVRAWSAIRQATDETCVASFAARIIMPARCLAGPGDAQPLVDSVNQTGSPSALWTALLQTMAWLDITRTADTRESIVAITDRMVSANFYGLEDVICRATSRGISVYPIMALPRLWAQAEGPAKERAAALLRTLASETGGIFQRCDRPSRTDVCDGRGGSLDVLLAKAAEDLRSTVIVELREPVSDTRIRQLIVRIQGRSTPLEIRRVR